jgi:signal transduction histidine kinase
VGEVSDKLLDITKKIKERCLLLGNLIKEMLELSNLKTAIRGNIKMEKAKVGKMVESVIAHLKDIAISKDIRIVTDSHADDIEVKCNRNQILILLSTLVENAIIYSEKNKTVTINIQKTSNKKCRFSVIDEGIGMEEKYMDKIFNEYFRMNKGVEMNEKGTGLGLAIAKEIADIHKTSIKVKSKVGRGSTFSFDLNVF